MAKYKLEALLVGLVILMTGAALSAIDSAYRSAPEMQLIAEDKALDGEIKDAILKIQALHTLTDFKSLSLSPQQSYVRLNNDGKCIDVDAHSQNHTIPNVKSQPADYQLRKITLCFAEKKLTQIESSFTAISESRKEKTLNRLTHKDPAVSAVDDVIITGSYNNMPNPALKVGDLENSFTKPHRLAFKRDYYLPHLKNTAYILQWTLDMHKRAAEKVNEKAVNIYLNYAN